MANAGMRLPTLLLESADESTRVSPNGFSSKLRSSLSLISPKRACKRLSSAHSGADVVQELRKEDDRAGTDEIYSKIEEQFGKQFISANRPQILSRTELGGGRVRSLLHVEGEQWVFAGLDHGELVRVDLLVVRFDIEPYSDFSSK